MGNKKYWVIGICIALSLILVISGAYLYLYTCNNQYSDKFYPGIVVNDIDVGEKTVEEATEIIENILAKEEYYTITNGDSAWEIPLEELVFYEIEITLQEILNKQIEYGLLEAHKARKRLIESPEHYYIDINVKEDIEALLTEIREEVEVKPKDAEFVITDDRKVSIVPHKSGITIDLEKNIEEINQSLNNNIFTSELVYTEYEPKTLTSDLKALRVEDLVFSVESSYGGTGDNRIYNIHRASSKITNHLLLPGETFSFNEVVGQANKANGYKEATVIINGQFVPGYGGGICQVSSNLYVAALKGNLEIVERRNHGRPVSYFPKGLDATIAYPSIDLKFKNNTPYGIIINTRPTSTHLNVDFYSYKPHYSNVRFENEEEIIPFETEYKNNPNLMGGQKKVVQKGTLGYRVNTYRIVTADGNTTRELISTDTYRAVNEVVEVGPLAEETEEGTQEND